MKPLSAAFGIARDAIAVAVFSGQELECWKIRSLPNNDEKARASALAFVRWASATFGFRAAGLESGSLGSKRKELLREGICGVLREQGIPILLASQEQLYLVFRQPPLKKRGEMRRIVSTILPQLQAYRSQLPLLDAAALGLYLETEHLLAINASNE